MNTPVIPAALLAFEAQFRRDAREHAALVDALGALVAARTGNQDSVTFTEQELNRACLGTLTHTHPLGKPPSKPDLSLAARYGLMLRAVGETPDGEAWDYTVRMPAASAQLADRIDALFADTLEVAEQELAAQPWNDFKWEREARHLAVTRLAQQLGFAYTRVRRDATISEMTQHETERLDVLTALESAMRSEVFVPLQAALIRTLTHAADSQGQIPVERLPMIKQQVTRQVQRVMLGPSQHGVLEPYHVQNGQVIPRSVYFKTLWSAMRAAAQAAIDRHAVIMRRYLPDDLRRLFEAATLSPFESVVSETEGNEFDPTLPQYDPLHLWVGPDGKQLSDRIWVAAGDMRQKLDAYLTEAIATRKPVQQIAAELESYLVTGRGNYEAVRLARTETAAAGHRADGAAARLDPFVETYTPFVAPSHRCCDRCDDMVAAAPYPKTDITHLPPYHPFCLCGVLWNLVKDISGVLARLHQQIEQAINAARRALSDVIGPLSKRFLDLLFRGRK